MMRIIPKIKKYRGFGLLEVIVALGIIIIGVLAGLSLATQNTFTRNISENRLVAANLAREPIEMIRRLRDTNWTSTDPNIYWYSGIVTNVGNPPDKKLIVKSDIDPSGNLIMGFQTVPNATTIDTCANCGLYYHADSGSFNSSSTNGTVSEYKRLVTLDWVCLNSSNGTILTITSNNNCTSTNDFIGWQITSEVKWSTKSVKLVDYVYNWR